MLNQLKNSLSKRIVIIGILALAMLVPLGMINGVITERGYYYDSVISEIAYLWGAEQILTGPILIVPFIEKRVHEEQVKNEFGKIETKSRAVYSQKKAMFLPKILNIQAGLAEQYRSRSIYNSLVYEAEISLTADFERPDIEKLSSHIERIEWHKAEIVVGLSDTKSIDEIRLIAWQGAPLRVSAGTGLNDMLPGGFQATIEGLEIATSPQQFELNIAIKGSRGFRFTPLGETTNASIESSWPHPKFAGNLLPDEHEITTDGFKASWQVPHLARNYPQSWVHEQLQPALTELVAGVDLFEPVFIYSKIDRAVKYGLLFIGLTFITFLSFELSTGSALHYVQYTLIGFALALFYLLLLSLSEHIDFLIAYIIAALACISMISLYASRALGNKRQGKVLFALLSVVFALLYALLRMEDYALLVGTWVLFAAIGVLMYLTRGINQEAIKTNVDGDRIR